MDKNKKISVKESWYIFTIVMLVVALVFCTVLFLQNPFITNKPVQTGLLPLGTSVNLFIDDSGSQSQVLFFYGSVLADLKIKQDVNITLKPTQEPCVVRGKVFMFDETNKQLPIDVFVSSNWRLGQDGYFYCTENLFAGLVLNFVNAVQIPASHNLNAESLYPIVFSVETLPLATDYEAIWGVL